MYNGIIVRYCEIHLKGKNRGYFENMLKDNLRDSLKGINCKFVPMRSRYLISDYDESDLVRIVSALKKVAGVHTFSPVLVVNNDIEEIYNAVKMVLADKKGTFKIITNRADKTFYPDSMGVSRLLGERVLNDFNGKLSVDVIEPEFPISVDIREDGKTFVYSQTIKGMSGMPVGSAGRGLMLISGGIDSPVAAYSIIKRGMKLDLLHFHSFPYTGEAAKQKVIDLSEKLSVFNGGINLYVAKFTEIQEEIHKKCPEEYMITIMRRFMMRIAERLSLRNGCQAIITGESLGQVASQTVESITSSNSVVERLPVLRPLIAFDKLDIIEISKKIGTYDISVLPFEDCCTVFLPKFPLIKPDLEKVKRVECVLDVEGLIKRVLDGIELIKL
ncbi:MAG: tRNA 4-thiouridine(8) synthase ThiI [Clostridia bacterium]|nr:tRNA 4-thiouridine(8) synthase ThiI [Clostridia bacterium]